MVKLKPINKDIKNIKGLSKAILITLLKAIILLIKNILYIEYLLIYNFNSFMGNLYLKMPRIVRVGVIYTLLFMAIVNMITIDKTEASIGMSNSIGDEAAIVFASQLYSSIGFGLSLEKAFQQAIVALKLYDIPEDETPKLFVSDGIEANEIYLVTKN